MNSFEPPADASRIAVHLQQTQPWVRFMSIVGFVSSGLMIVGGLVAGAVGAATGRADAGVLVLVYPIMGILYIVPSLYLSRYADGIRRFVASQDAQHLESALDAQRAFWKFVGLLTAISLAILVIGTALVIAIGVAAGRMAGG